MPSVPAVLQIKANTTVEWFNMKGPQIYFPITVENSDTDKCYRKTSVSKEEHEENNAEPDRENEETQPPVSVEEIKPQLD